MDGPLSDARIYASAWGFLPEQIDVPTVDPETAIKVEKLANGFWRPYSLAWRLSCCT